MDSYIKDLLLPKELNVNITEILYITPPSKEDSETFIEIPLANYNRSVSYISSSDTLDPSTWTSKKGNGSHATRLFWKSCHPQIKVNLMLNILNGRLLQLDQGENLINVKQIGLSWQKIVLNSKIVLFSIPN